MDKPDFVYVIYIEASPRSVWEALTSGEFTRQYWGGRRIQSNWQVGAPVQFVREDGGIDWQGEILKSQPPKLLSYTFHMQISEAHRSEQPSHVTFELEQVGDMVRLTLIHSHLEADSATFETTRHGWPAIMSSLKSLLETGRPLPFRGLGFGGRDRQGEA